jgi:hypothetical protein
MNKTDKGTQKLPLQAIWSEGPLIKLLLKFNDKLYGSIIYYFILYFHQQVWIEYLSKRRLNKCGNGGKCGKLEPEGLGVSGLLLQLVCAVKQLQILLRLCL